VLFVADLKLVLLFLLRREAGPILVTMPRQGGADVVSTGTRIPTRGAPHRGGRSGKEPQPAVAR
jgi:hypothetical protein